MSVVLLHAGVVGLLISCVLLHMHVSLRKGMMGSTRCENNHDFDIVVTVVSRQIRPLGC